MQTNTGEDRYFRSWVWDNKEKKFCAGKIRMSLNDFLYYALGKVKAKA